MRLKRSAVMTILVPVLFAGGCVPAVNKTGPAPDFVSIEERNFAGALQHLRSGNEFGARELLERVIDAKPLPGVTDEAMFRLALLNLGEEVGRGELRATELLSRLTSEFPASIWAKQAAPLAAYLREAISLRSRERGLRSLRNQNLSLNRDNKELRQIIDRLKTLDLEMEQKIRR